MNQGHREDFDEMGFARFLPIYHTSIRLNYLSIIIVPFLRQVLYLKFF